jgi:predicted nucleic acid-binding protein
MATMVDRLFVDTNVVLQATFRAAPSHKACVTALEAYKRQGADLWINRQVIREFLSQITRNQQYMQALTVDQATKAARILQQDYQIADETSKVTETLLGLLEQFPTGGKQVHDASIIATMLVYNIPGLLSMNIDDLKRFTPMIDLVPVA